MTADNPMVDQLPTNVCHAYFTLVTLGETGKAAPLPKLLPADEVIVPERATVTVDLTGGAA